MKISIVTGCCGMIGSNLVQRLLPVGPVIGIDNLFLGKMENISRFCDDANFTFYNVSLDEYPSLDELFKEIIRGDFSYEIWHLAANSDIRAGTDNASIDLRDTFLTTFNLLEASKAYNIKNFYFASSSAVYGNHGTTQLKESSGNLLPISNYGAMKNASESVLSVANNAFLEKTMIFRFPNIVGLPLTHGILYDFINKIKQSKEILEVLGNGTQSKEYLHVDELIDAMILLVQRGGRGLSIYNIGSNGTSTTVSSIAERFIETLSPETKIRYGDTNYGWVGDIPCFNYSIEKAIDLGWTPKLTSDQAIDAVLLEIKDSHS